MRPPIRSIHRAAAMTFGGVAVALTLGVGPALAHIDPDPAEVTAGATVTVGFGVEHGCDGSNTTQLVFQIPDGVTDAAAVEQTGWTTSATGDTVTFAGGNLDAATPQTFSLRFTAPSTPGVIHFPIVQTCVVGELAWIEVAAEGQPEPDHPAPEVQVVADPNAQPGGSVATDGTNTASSVAPTAVDSAPTSASTQDSVATAVTETIATDSTSATTTVGAAKSSGADDGGNTGLVVGIAVGAVVVIGGAALVARRRKAPSA